MSKNLSVAHPVAVLKHAQVLHEEPSLVPFRIVEAERRDPIADVHHDALIYVALGSFSEKLAEITPARSYARLLLHTRIVPSPEKISLNDACVGD